MTLEEKLKALYPWVVIWNSDDHIANVLLSKMSNDVKRVKIISAADLDICNLDSGYIITHIVIIGWKILMGSHLIDVAAY